MVQSGCVNGSFAAASVDAKVVCRGGGLAPRERPAESDSIAPLVVSLLRRGAPFGNEFGGASSGRHQQTYDTRVLSKIHSLANLAVARATCRLEFGVPIEPMVRLRPLFLNAITSPEITGGPVHSGRHGASRVRVWHLVSERVTKPGGWSDGVVRPHSALAVRPARCPQWRPRATLSSSHRSRSTAAR